ncbi:MAG: hypothetical protein U9Q98_05595 [Bacteroidota bacterium]|nr:hypothetical protein [Bacteroidota bacterium]
MKIKYECNTKLRSMKINNNKRLFRAIIRASAQLLRPSGRGLCTHWKKYLFILAQQINFVFCTEKLFALGDKEHIGRHVTIAAGRFVKFYPKIKPGEQRYGTERKHF